MSMGKYYLTIDDGPHEDFTVRCEALEQRGILAMWYCQGDMLEKYPEAVIAAIKKGHVIGNHSYNHPFFSKLTSDEAWQQIKKTDSIIDSLYHAAGVERTVKTFRFPYLDLGGSENNRFLHTLGYSQPVFEGKVPHALKQEHILRSVGVGASIDTRDWQLGKTTETGELFDEEHMFKHIAQQLDEIQDEGEHHVVLTHSFVPLSTFLKTVDMFLAAGKTFDIPHEQRQMHLEPVERQDEHHQKKHSWIMAMPDREAIEVVLFGDSITRRWEDNQEVFERYFGEYSCWNFGIGADTINNMIWRIENGELDGMSPKMVILLLGTNSLSEYSNDKMVEAIIYTVDKIQAICSEAVLLLHGIFPRNPDGDQRDYLSRIREINEELAATQRDKLVYVEMTDVLLNHQTMVDEAIMPDGLHINDKGYEIWGQTLKPLLRQYMGR